MRYTIPACPATGSPRIEHQISRPSPGEVVVQRRSGDGPWEDLLPSDLRQTLAAPTDLASWLREAMGPRPAHRPRRDPAAARINLVVRVRPTTRQKIITESQRTGESQGQVVDRLANGIEG